jgi:hydroxypyruvate reductase
MQLSELRHSARLIWEAALDAANPATCIRKVISLNGDELSIGGQKIPIRGRVIVVGTGKASARMAQVLEEILGGHISAGVVSTKYGHALPLQRIRLIEAGHPIPDAAGVQAVEETREIVRGLTKDDIVLCLISGGGSALWPAPVAGITLEEKQKVTQLLLRAGATILELNAVRKHLSDIKGGQLARWASPAHVISLIISDVIGDPIDFIASGPTAPDTTSFSDALAILDRYRVEVPAPVRKRFEEGAAGRIADTPKPGDPVFQHVENHIIANNRLIVEAATAKAKELRFSTLVLGTGFEGEAREVGGIFAAIAREIQASGNPIPAPACVIAAGETTVTVRGDGIGGRNQEMALAWAIAMALRASASTACFASVASDGTDGPTDAAGGIVDPLTCNRASEQGMTPAKFLQNNDSFHLLKATGDLIVTGPTYTNLMDLQILLAGG